MTPKLPPEFLTRPLAHRALHDVADGRPENSRAAIGAAIAAGYGIEIDLQASADGQAMVFHDYELARLADAQGTVQGRTAADLGNIQLKGGDEGVPTLVEVLRLVAGRVPLLIEIKDQDGALGSSVGALEDATARALQSYAGPVAVMSFNPHSTQRMQAILPHIPRGLVTGAFDPGIWPVPSDVCTRLRDIPDYDAAGCSFISHDRRDLARPRVAELKAAGANILCWTVKSPAQEAEARKVAQNITFEKYLAPFPG
ncbi:MAG: glycerophosphodiester phosphodiesterase family protein [Roseobacter sp.]